jgi:hypothetical protein
VLHPFPLHTNFITVARLRPLQLLTTLSIHRHVKSIFEGQSKAVSSKEFIDRVWSLYAATILDLYRPRTARHALEVGFTRCLRRTKKISLLSLLFLPFSIPPTSLYQLCYCLHSWPLAGFEMTRDSWRCSSALKTQTECFSETLVSTCESTRRYNIVIFTATRTSNLIKNSCWLRCLKSATQV